MKTYQAIIFDLGNVVFHCSFDPVCRYWGKLSGYTPEKIKELIATCKAHENFEKGIISSEEFRRQLSRHINYPLSEDEFKAGWNSIYGNTFKGINTLLDKLKKDYRIIALTNTNSTHSSIWRRKYQDTLVHFERIFSSHEMKFRKPDDKAFTTCVDYLGLPPEEIIFLDDKQENITAAVQLGINGILVKSTDQMIRELNKRNLNT